MQCICYHVSTCTILCAFYVLGKEDHSAPKLSREYEFIDYVQNFIHNEDLIGKGILHS